MFGWVVDRILEMDGAIAEAAAFSNTQLLLLKVVWLPYFFTVGYLQKIITPIR